MGLTTAYLSCFDLPMARVLKTATDSERHCKRGFGAGEMKPKEDRYNYSTYYSPLYVSATKENRIQKLHETTINY